MGKLIEYKRIGINTVMVKLEATKRIKIWLRIDPEIEAVKIHSCSPERCEFFKSCGKIKVPIIKRDNRFDDLCNQLFQDYPELKKYLERDFIGQMFLGRVIPVKIGWRNKEED